jgi:hypothetical protein
MRAGFRPACDEGNGMDCAITLVVERADLNVFRGPGRKYLGAKSLHGKTGSKVHLGMTAAVPFM